MAMLHCINWHPVSNLSPGLGKQVIRRQMSPTCVLGFELIFPELAHQVAHRNTRTLGCQHTLLDLVDYIKVRGRRTNNHKFHASFDRAQ